MFLQRRHTTKEKFIGTLSLRTTLRVNIRITMEIRPKMTIHRPATLVFLTCYMSILKLTVLCQAAYDNKLGSPSSVGGSIPCLPRFSSAISLGDNGGDLCCVYSFRSRTEWRWKYFPHKSSFRYDIPGKSSLHNWSFTNSILWVGRGYVWLLWTESSSAGRRCSLEWSFAEIGRNWLESYWISGAVFALWRTLESGWLGRFN